MRSLRGFLAAYDGDPEAAARAAVMVGCARRIGRGRPAQFRSTAEVDPQHFRWRRPAQLVADSGEGGELVGVERAANPAPDRGRVLHRDVVVQVVAGLGHADDRAAPVAGVGRLLDEPARGESVEQPAHAGLGEQQLLVEVPDAACRPSCRDRLNNTSYSLNESSSVGNSRCRSRSTVT